MSWENLNNSAIREKSAENQALISDGDITHEGLFELREWLKQHFNFHEGWLGETASWQEYAQKSTL